MSPWLLRSRTGVALLGFLAIAAFLRGLPDATGAGRRTPHFTRMSAVIASRGSGRGATWRSAPSRIQTARITIAAIR